MKRSHKGSRHLLAPCGGVGAQGKDSFPAYTVLHRCPVGARLGSVDCGSAGVPPAFPQLRLLKNGETPTVLSEKSLLFVVPIGRKNLLGRAAPLSGRSPAGCGCARSRG